MPAEAGTHYTFAFFLMFVVGPGLRRDDEKWEHFVCVGTRHVAGRRLIVDFVAE